jgi:phosphomethylpyrimidine synthase
MDSFKLKNHIGIGGSYPIRVNCNFGINNIKDEKSEKNKIESLYSNMFYRTDLAMDLSTIKLKKPLYEYISKKFNICVGTVPVYLSFDHNEGINKNRLLDVINEQAEKGVSFFTLHFSADLDLYQKAVKSRKIAITSRGGGLLISDQKIKGKNQNILIENIDEIIKVCKNKNIAISVGTAFRPASIFEARDEVHLAETHRQLKIVKYLKNNDINVIVENVGHITLDLLDQHIKMLKDFNSPIMPLGPVPTDIALGNDHIASSIGAAFLAYRGVTHIINSITPDEHSNTRISLKATKVGIEAAKITSHIINLTKSKKYWLADHEVYSMRSLNKSCLSDKVCFRCADQCPLKF